MIQPIVLYSQNHKILKTKTKSSDIVRDKDDLQKLIEDMKDTLQSVGGLGLAANQIGRNESICLVQFGDELITMVNPIIIGRNGETKISIERCLSLPDITARVERDEIVSLKFINPDNNWQEEEIKIDEDNERMDIIGQNGNEGLHYENEPPPPPSPLLKPKLQEHKPKFVEYLAPNTSENDEEKKNL